MLVNFIKLKKVMVNKVLIYKFYGDIGRKSWLYFYTSILENYVFKSLVYFYSICLSVSACLSVYLPRNMLLCTPDWPWSYHVVEGNFKLLTLLCLPPTCWDYMCVPPQQAPGVEPRPSCMQGRQAPYQWSQSPRPSCTSCIISVFIIEG